MKFKIKKLKEFIVEFDINCGYCYGFIPHNNKQKINMITDYYKYLYDDNIKIINEELKTNLTLVY